VEDDLVYRKLRPLNAPRPLAEDAAEVIRERILDGRFQHGEHLVEATLARQLHISRGPVREAFKLLRAEGLVAEEPRRGTFVVTLSGRDIGEIYDLRAAIEGAAASAIATSHDVDSVKELHAIIDRMTGAVSRGDLRAVGASDLEFHEAICRLSGNSRLHTVFLQHVLALRTLIKVDEHLYSSAAIVSQHRPLLDAIERGDAPLAKALCEAHCRDAKDTVLAYIEALPDG
jgi:GntR family transcriptional regulator of gluconate operon